MQPPTIPIPSILRFNGFLVAGHSLLHSKGWFSCKDLLTCTYSYTAQLVSFIFTRQSSTTPRFKLNLPLTLTNIINLSIMATIAADDSPSEEESVSRRPSSTSTTPDDNDHLCPHPGCHKSFASKTGLDNHFRVHLTDSDKPFIYPHPGCDMRYTGKRAVDRHYNLKHTDQSNWLNCPAEECDASFPEERQLKLHQVEHGVFRCTATRCVYECDSEQELYNHREVSELSESSICGSANTSCSGIILNLTFTKAVLVRRHQESLKRQDPKLLAQFHLIKFQMKRKQEMRSLLMTGKERTSTTMMIMMKRMMLSSSRLPLTIMWRIPKIKSPRNQRKNLGCVLSQTVEYVA